LTDVRFVAPEPDGPLEATAAPTISIAIPCYQAAGTIAAAVESALGQTLRPHEVIVCDDGSTDDIDSELSPYGDAIRLIRKKNGGVASARNALVRAATGDFVATLDADDLYEPRRLEAITALAAARPDLDIVTTDGWMERDGIREGRLFELNPFARDDQRIAILDRCFFGSWPAVRRSRVIEMGGYDERLRIGEDWDLWIRLIYSGSLAGMVDEPLMTYRRSGTSLTGNLIADLHARVTVLERGRRLEGLNTAEREALEASLRAKRHYYAVQRIVAAMGDGGRMNLLRSATTRGAPIRSRAGAVRAALRARTTPR
jgi:glycosyltransferase involved in cell wall biosynthesis